MTFNKTIYTFMLSFLFSLLMSISYASNYDPLVEILQRNLSLLNYKPGPTDGLWGRKTQQSYEEFLKDNKLPISKNPRSFSIEEVIEARLEKIKTNLVKRDHLKQPLNIRDAAHLLRRTGFGAHPYEVKQLLNETRAEGIIKILEGISTQGEFLPPDFMNKNIPPYFMKHSIDFRFDRNREGDLGQLKSWFLNKMITSSIPQLEKLTLFWHNHFVSSFKGTDENPNILFLQNKTFRKYGNTNFKLLTKLMLSDAALLKYLDNDDNHKYRPNENLARELMELFTLGEGNYSEETIKEAAKTLTGYSFNRINFSPYFFKETHDFGQKILFGESGNFDPYDLIDLIFEQPSASTFIISKFWKLYISELNPPNQELDAIAFKFKDSDFDLIVLISEILASQSFWNEENRGTIIKSPIDLLVGITRSTGHVTKLTSSFPSKIDLLGQNLFEHPNVAGWPGGSDWISSTRLLTRKQYIKLFLESFEKNSTSKDNIVIAKKNPARLSLELKNLYASVWSKSFKSNSKEGGMSIYLFHSALKDGFRFGFGGNIAEDEVFFCINKPGTVKYFLEDLADYFDDNNYGFCHSSDWGSPEKFLKRIFSMNDEDISKIDLVCQFLASQEIKEWMKSGKSNSTYGNHKSLGNKKLREFYSSRATLKKMSDLGQKCKNVLDHYFESKKEKHKTTFLVNELNNYEPNKLTLDTARFIHIQEIKKSKKEYNLLLGLHDLVFNSISQKGMVIRLSVKSNSPQRFRISLSDMLCDSKCFSKAFRNHDYSIFLNPNKRQENEFKSLSEEDKKFAAILWLVLPNLIHHAEKFKNGNSDFIQNLNSWKKELDDIKRIMLNSPYKKYVPDFKMTITEKAYPKVENVNSMMTTNMTTPTSITLEQNIATKNKDDFLNKVEKLGIDIEKELSDLLLSINPVTNLSDSDRIKALFEDPAFQLN